MDLIEVSLAWSDQELITTIPRWDVNPSPFPWALTSTLAWCEPLGNSKQFFPKEPYHWCLRAWLSVGDKSKQTVVKLNKSALRSISNCIFWGKLSAKKVMNIIERICKCPITFKYETGKIYLKYLIALEIVEIYGEIP